VYLAAPFFTLSQQWLVELCKAACEELGAEVFSPLHDVGAGGPAVAALDLDGLASCSVVLALLDESDPGTWIEVGWARSRNKPVIGYCEPQAEEQTKMAKGLGVEVHADLSTALYRAIWAGMGPG
jgi:nucleoside 2-deoxyribosyltransferase